MLLPWSKVFKFQVSSSKIKMPNIFTHFDSLQKSKSAISPKNNWIALSLKKTSETHEKPMRKFPTLHFYYALSKYDAFLTSCLLAVKPVYWFAVYCSATHANWFNPAMAQWSTSLHTFDENVCCSTSREIKSSWLRIGKFKNPSAVHCLVRKQ